MGEVVEVIYPELLNAFDLLSSRKISTSPYVLNLTIFTAQ